MKRGFTLVENLVAVAIFALLAGAVYQTSSLLIRSVGSYRENTTISSLANQYMEIVHNLPYSSIGTVLGNPSGSLPSEVSATSTFINGTAYKIYYAVGYIDDPADGTIEARTDPASADYKQVKLYIKNVDTEKSYSFLTNITPKGLEGLSAGGALVISVIDASGNPVPNATINITNTNLIPNINLTRTTDANGKWIEVGLSESANSYHIVATKNGYSSDQTYPITVGNPDPVKTDSTIITGQATQVSFAIDKLSSLSFETLDQNCNKISGVGMNIRGTKKIGKPNLLKFDQSYTSTQGEIDLGLIEWDSYTPTLSGSTYDVYGSSPIQQVSVLPNTTQNYTLLLGPKTTNSLLVIVKDDANDNPLENATVQLQNSNPSFDQSKITGGSVWSSSLWSSVAGQEIYNVNTDIVPYALRLQSNDGGVTYASNGTLTSEVFDTGTASTTYSTINWQPTSQSTGTEIKFQVATSNDNTATTTWNFIGPYGTNTDYYTTSGTNINNPPARYIRYRAFLSTSDINRTPVLTSLNINYVSGCFTPGQVFFSGLTADDSYNLTVSAAGYTTQVVNGLNITGYNTKSISL